MVEKYKLSNNESHQITRDSIIEAFKILSKDRAINDISITELCAKAGVSRAGFYLNFKNLEEVMHEITKETIEDFFVDIFDEYGKDDSLDFWKPAVDFILKHEDFYMSIINSKEEIYYLDQMCKKFEETVNRRVSMNKMEYYFWSGGLFMMIRAWLLGGKKEPIEDLIRVLSPSN